MPVQRFIGLMSGTSLDGVDAALVRFDDDQAKVERCLTHAFDPALREALSALCTQQTIDLAELTAAERRLSQTYAESVDDLIHHSDVTRQSITAIGCHGQTIRHLPADGFSWQIGNPAQLAVATDLPVVADFRRTDMALGGEGAPLAPAFHQAFFGDESEHRMAVNLGGIGNVSDLPPGGMVTGWDTGPANTLMDYWYRRHHAGGDWDSGGYWASQGTPVEALVERLLDDEYFRRRPPKSTGPEHFSPDWLECRLDNFSHCRPVDIQASLLELTCRSVATAVRNSGAQQAVLSGGGAFNTALVERLAELLPGQTVCTADQLGIPADQVESAGFAWLARQHWLGQPGNVPSVTGASRPARLGAVWYPAR